MTRTVGALRALGLFGLTVFVSAAASSILVRHMGRRPAVDVRALQTSDRYRTATVYYQGMLAPHAATTVRRSRDSARLAVVLVLRRRDVETCEDLGRQLRELRRALGPTRPMIVLADSADVEDVTNFVVTERITSVVIEPEGVNHVYDSSVAFATPAVLLVDTRDSVVQGVAHPLRFPDARVKSFASELTALVAGQ